MKFLRDELKPRLYQERILNKCVNNDCLVVLPTGLGKTIIALMLSVYTLHQDEGGKVLFLAPTKPLVEQHLNTFKEFIQCEEGELISVSGEVSPEERRGLYDDAVIVFATPQTIQNDLITRGFELDDVGLVVFDECHRGVGEYAYTFVSEVYEKQNPTGKVLGLSASPGSSKDKILDVCKNLRLNDVVYMSKEHEHVKPYVKDKKLNKVILELPSELEGVKSKLELTLKKRLKVLKNKGLVNTYNINSVSKGMFLKIQRMLQGKIKKRDTEPGVYENISLVAEVIKILYSLELLQTQGVKPLISYFKKMKKQKKVKANRSLFKDEDFREAVRETFNLEDKIDHPKFHKVKELILKNLETDEKFIIFTQYRNTGKRLVQQLEKVGGVNPVLFIGQSGSDGLTQKQQLSIVNEFSQGEYNVLVATSVAEEGLHIPSVDYAIFFEPVPSGLRMIQRRGRVGRTKVGTVFVMYTKGCLDEKYYYVSQAKEDRMKRAIHEVQEVLDKSQKSLGDF